MMKIGLFKLLVGLLLALGVSLPAVAQKTITLGASVQLTGHLANTARYYKDAYNYAIDKINAAGGVTVGGQTYQLALKLYDNQSDVNLSVRQYTQLVTQDKVNFLLGPFASDFTIPDSAIAEKYQIPMIEGGGASDQIFSRGYKYIFGTLASASLYFASTIEMLGKLNPAPKTVALLYADDSFDVSVAKGTRDLLSKAGFKLVLDSRYSANASNFSSILSQIKAKNPDVVLMACHETEALNFLRQAKGLGVSPKLYSFTVGVPTADFRQALGADANYAYGMTAWVPSSSLKDKYFGDAEQFAKTWKTKFGYDPDYHVASGVTDVEAFVRAIEAAGSLDPQKVRDAIANLSFDNLYGHIAFRDNGQINLAQTVVQIQNGKVAPIYATDFINKPQYPMPSWSAR